MSLRKGSIDHGFGFQPTTSEASSEAKPTRTGGYVGIFLGFLGTAASLVMIEQSGHPESLLYGLRCLALIVAAGSSGLTAASGYAIAKRS